jgi:hypothetical protein
MKNIYFAILLVLSAVKGFSQGCSDAGFCSLSILKNDAPVSSKHILAIGTGYGLGEENTSVISSYLEYKWRLNSKWSVQSKLTSAYASGFLGNNINLGDVYGLASYVAQEKPHHKINILAGFKIPLTVSNDKYQGRSLPLDYQSSVGTYDIIAGASYILHNKWELNAGIQAPVIQRNKNTFYPDEYNDPKAGSFAPTNNFERKPDVLLRAGYLFQTGNKVTVKPNLLAIYHIGKDSYENRFGQRKAINGSQGLTLNAGVNTSKTFPNGHQLELVLATPFVVREVRADGLTRSFVINIQYSFPL